jgi:hypothetical protein
VARVGPVGAGDLGRDPLLALRLGRPRQVGILAQETFVQVLELLGGVEPQFLTEALVETSIGHERLRLAPRAVEGQHQLTVRPLVERLVVDGRFQLGEDDTVAARRELAVDAVRGGRCS